MSPAHGFLLAAAVHFQHLKHCEDCAEHHDCDEGRLLKREVDALGNAGEEET